jgi:hypothetical protein
VRAGLAPLGTPARRVGEGQGAPVTDSTIGPFESDYRPSWQEKTNWLRSRSRMSDRRFRFHCVKASSHALLVKAVSDPDWQAAREALDELLRKLLVVHRLLEAEERLAKRERGSEPE